MLYKLIILQIIAHLLADFIFQPHIWVQSKSKKIISKEHVFHGLVVFACAYVLSLDYHFWIAALLIAIVHFLTDIFKSSLQIYTRKKGKEGSFFFGDQLVHIIALLIITIFYINRCGISFVVDISTEYLLIALAFIACSKPANIFIKNIFSSFKIKVPTNEESDTDQADVPTDDKSLPNAGKLIGIMERFLVLALILVGQYSAVGLIIAAKSILRYKTPLKNEYILVGTLLSFGIAVIVGILVVKLSILA